MSQPSPTPSPPQDLPPGLPILERRGDIEAALRSSQVVIICGETGSGKTTQLPQICLALGLAPGQGKGGIIGHTQPRRLAARAVAARIAEERAEALGSTVGVKVRFNDQTSRATRIKVMTDGMLLAELGSDPELKAYSCLIIDEAHERSLNIDFLLGVLKQLLPRRPDLKVVVTSATIDPKRFSDFFASTAGGAPIIEVSGRMYPVEVRYRPTGADEETFDRVEFEAVADAAEALCRAPGGGDVLVFLPGEREIRLAGDALSRRGVNAAVLPLYSRLTDQQQDQIFHPARDGRRRVILATNVAETSLTVPGIRFVIDTGVARISRYDPLRKVQRLPVEAISQASANQRSGRCGRVAVGVCVRLYSEESFRARPRFTDPEIRRTSLANVILQMKALGLGAVEAFPFLEKPDSAAIKDGYETLFELGAIDTAGPDGRLTDIGRRISRVPLDARIARMLLGAASEGVLDEVTTLAAVLSIQDPRERPMSRAEEADRAQLVFRDPTSDFLTLLKLWDQYRHAAESMGGGQLAAWCREHYLSAARMREWGELIRQLRDVVKDIELESAPVGPQSPPLQNRIHRALLTGLITNVACREGDGSFDYRGVRGNVVQVFPGSVLFKKGPKWIMAAEVVHTTRLYARTVARIEPEWIEELAGHMFRRQVCDAHLDKATGEPSAWERVTMSGIVVVPRRQTPLAAIDPAAARKVFIREALAEGRWDTDLPFMLHNRQVMDDARRAEAKLRRRDVLADPDVLVAWFEERVPPEVVDAGTFTAWYPAQVQHDPQALCVPLELVLNAGAKAALDPHAFPDALPIDDDEGHLELPLDYTFAQGKPEDGVTATVQLRDLPRLTTQRAAWLVPGLLPQVVLALVKSLPKGMRAEVERKGKAEDVAAGAAELMEFGRAELPSALAEALEVLHALKIDPAALSPSALPPSLRLRVRVLDDAGEEVAADRDLAALQQRLEAKVKKARAAVQRVETERHGIITWDFGPLPGTLSTGGTTSGFAALTDRGTSVSLTLVPTQTQAAAYTLLALRRLFALAIRDEAQYYVDALPQWHDMTRWYAQLGPPEELREHIITVTAGRVFMEGQAPITTNEQFEARLLEHAGRLAVATREVGESFAKWLEPRFLVAKRLSGGTPSIWAESVADIREQAAYLLPRGFLSVLWWERLRHYPRYVGTMWERLLAMREEGREANLAPLKVVTPHWKRYTAWLAAAMSDARRRQEEPSTATAPAGKGKPALPQARRAAPTVNADAGEWALAPGRLPLALEQYRWAVEDLRVSLFAPHLAGGNAPKPADLDRLWHLVPPAA
ncbi:MAG TPA: ATP-dependent RNA helicase HrpA [Phycisphaerales bacterium]|nr:ATP-dependent RNA helicase HrpA [Phycisphaerales bacterium]